MGKVRNKSKEKWECKQCGICCQFILIPVQENVDLETETYLEAHGIRYDGEKLSIPARCKYLTKDNKCGIHSAKFANCRLAGEKECKEALKGWSLLNRKD